MRRVSVATALLLALARSLAGQDSTFLLSTADPAYRTPTFLGNGAFSLVTTPTGAAAALSFAAGVYDHAPGDVPRIAALPAWNAIDVSDGRAWLGAAARDTSTLSGYRQTLDMFDGVLRTSYDWVEGDRRTSVSVEAFVSRANSRLAAVKLVLVPRFTGRVTLVFPLRSQTPPHRLALERLEQSEPGWDPATLWYPGYVALRGRGVTRDSARTGGDLWLAGRTVGRGTAVAIAARVGWPAGQRPVSLRPVWSDSGVTLEASFDATADVPLTAYKYIGVASSVDSAPVARVQEVAGAAAARGYDALLAAHVAAWHALWETDIVVEGDPQLQRLVHAMLFGLLASAREGTDLSIPPMGLSSAGYYGHMFWDGDTWMFPALVVLHPRIARSLVGFRVRALAAARRNAQAHGYRGAQYPWESDELGEETTPRFAWQNALDEIHVNGDVALAQWQYFLATGDTDWLGCCGYPVIRATADFWVSRATLDSATGRYGIRHVVSVDEGLIGVGNDAYTNAVARKNLEIAVAASRRLRRQADPRWARVAERLDVPYDSAGLYHPTFDGAPPEKQGAVVPLLAYPLALPMRLMRREGPGVMMTVTLYAVVAAELGDRALVDSLLPLSYRGYVRPPFDVLAETQTSQGVDFLTGAGGFLQQVEFGYTGLRLSERGLEPTFAPALPSAVRRLVLRNISVRSRRYDIVVEHDTTRFVPR